MSFQELKIGYSSLTTNSVSINWENINFNELHVATHGYDVVSSKKVYGNNCNLKYLKDDTIYNIILANDCKETSIEICTLANTPMHLRVTDIQENSATVDWSCGGDLKKSKFIIEVLLADSHEMDQILKHEFEGFPIFGRTCFHYKIHNLRRNSQYFVSVKRINQFGLETEPTDLIFKTKCGLKPIPLMNSKLNCYQNSVLQALSSCDKYKDEIDNLISKTGGNDRLRTFSFILEYLRGNYRDCEDDFHCIDLTENELFHDWNKYYDQHDSFEFASYIVNHIFEGFMRNQNYRIPMQLFQQHNVRCGCGAEDCSSPVQTYLALHVSIPNNQQIADLQSLVDCYLSPVSIDYYECDKSGCKNENKNAHKLMKLLSPLPRTICIQLQRKFWNGHFMQLINTHVKFREFLDIKRDLTMEEDVKYALKSVIVYHGDDTDGHYICLRKLVDTWFVTNDIYSCPIQDDQVFNVEPYILFYEETEV